MLKPVRYERGIVYLIDQRRLPSSVEILECRTHGEVASAIKAMAVRGAPAIGIAAAYGMALAAREALKEVTGRCSGGLRPAETVASYLQKAAQTLKATRPTAVNLFWAVDRMMNSARGWLDSHGRDIPSFEGLAGTLEREARTIDEEDVEANRRLGAYGSELIEDGFGILTHCNAGALATGGYGTALGVIRAAWESGKRIHVYADETRPLLQGARLTAWELVNDGIPVTLLTDNMAGYVMSLGRVQAVIVGADRIARNGDVANKIGTYSIACLARAHGIPFYVAAPGSTIDLSIARGADIPIEQRGEEEVTHIGGVRIAPEGIAVFNPAFDVTPAGLITAIITEKGVIREPYEESLTKMFS